MHNQLSHFRMLAMKQKNRKVTNSVRWTEARRVEISYFSSCFPLKYRPLMPFSLLISFEKNAIFARKRFFDDQKN
jgi:hypothetical protein